jgi:hypothetical protein
MDSEEKSRFWTLLYASVRRSKTGIGGLAAATVGNCWLLRGLIMEHGVVGVHCWG